MSNFFVHDFFLFLLVDLFFLRLSVLLAWVLSNFLVTAVITTTNAKASTSGANVAVSGYMTLLSVARLYVPSFLTRIVGFFSNEKLILVVRFCGSTGYIIVRMFGFFYFYFFSYSLFRTLVDYLLRNLILSGDSFVDLTKFFVILIGSRP